MLDDVAKLISIVLTASRAEALGATFRLGALFERSTRPRESIAFYESLLGSALSRVTLSRRQQAEVATTLCQAVGERLREPGLTESAVSVLSGGDLTMTLPPLLSLVTSRWGDLRAEARVHFCVMLRLYLLPLDEQGRPVKAVLRCFQESDPRPLLGRSFLPSRHRQLGDAIAGAKALESYMEVPDEGTGR